MRPCVNLHGSQRLNQVLDIVAITQLRHDHYGVVAVADGRCHPNLRNPSAGPLGELGDGRTRVRRPGSESR
jgi:hypothetical protein